MYTTNKFVQKRLEPIRASRNSRYALSSIERNTIVQEYSSGLQSSQVGKRHHISAAYVRFLSFIHTHKREPEFSSLFQKIEKEESNNARQEL